MNRGQYTTSSCLSLRGVLCGFKLEDQAYRRSHKHVARVKTVRVSAFVVFVSHSIVRIARVVYHLY